MHKNVLLAVKNKSDGEKIIARAKTWTQRLEGNLCMQTVVELMPLFTGESSYFYEEIYAKEEIAIEHAERDLHFLADKFQLDPAATFVSIGSLRPAINQGLKDHHAELLVVGSHKHSVFERIIGDDSSSNLQYCEADVLSLNYDEDRTELELNNILVPIAFSDSSGRLLEKAKAIAELFNANISLLHVYPRSIFRTKNSKYEQELQEKAESKMADLIRQHSLNNATYTVLFGDPSDCVARYATYNDFDLIVVGRNHSDFKDLIVGSAATSILNRVRCDVFTVRLA